jgi:hypothetical protein
VEVLTLRSRAEGALRLPKEWTDLADAPLCAGASILEFQQLVALAELLQDIERARSKELDT